MFSLKSVNSALKFSVSVLITLKIIAIPVYAANLAIVIDDLGYSTKRDQQILAFPVTVAIIPTAPNAKVRGEEAQAKNREVILHLPMLPFNAKNLEPDTLTPEMSQQQISTIIQRSLDVVPMAIGINNHMGSAMTSDLLGMRRVFKALEDSNLFFLDSLTTGKSQAKQAAEEFNRHILKRDVFLDDTISESVIDHQFDEALRVARKNGHAIAIGHPHQATINVLNRRLADLPTDIHLVRLAQLQDLNTQFVKDEHSGQQIKEDFSPISNRSLNSALGTGTEQQNLDSSLSTQGLNNTNANKDENVGLTTSKMIGVAQLQENEKEKNTKESEVTKTEATEIENKETKQTKEDVQPVNETTNQLLDFSKLKVALPLFVKKIILASPNSKQSDQLLDSSELIAPNPTHVPSTLDQEATAE